MSELQEKYYKAIIDKTISEEITNVDREEEEKVGFVVCCLFVCLFVCCLFFFFFVVCLFDVCLFDVCLLFVYLFVCLLFVARL